MTFDSTYTEFCYLRVRLGFDPEFAMKREVWERCEPEAQEDMLEQPRMLVRKIDRYEATHGEVW